MTTWITIYATTVHRNGSTDTVRQQNAAQELMWKRGDRRSRQISRRHFVKSCEWSEADGTTHTIISVKKPGQEEKDIFTKSFFPIFP